MNKRMHTVYPPAFKEQAVQRAKAGDMSVRGLEQELGLSTNLLRQWVQKSDKHAKNAVVREATEGGTAAAAAAVTNSSVTTAAAPSQQAVQQQVFQQQVFQQQAYRIAQLEQENSILKKVLALLSVEQL